MNILILGLNSYVAHYTCKELLKNNSITGISRTSYESNKEVKYIEGDSLDQNLILNTIKENNINLVLNCVSMGIVDECEKNQEQAKKLNLSFVKELVSITNNTNTKLVHFSTNAVYGGDNPPYSESSSKNPKNYYGKVKAEADDYVLENSSNFLLIRPITLFGPKMNFHRDNPASMILKFLSEDKDMKLVNDLYGNLLFIDDFSKVVTQLIESNVNGEFNVSGDEIVNRYEFGMIILKKLEECSSKITECRSDEFPSYAPRSLNTSFVNSKVKDLLDFEFTSLEDAISETIRRTRGIN